MDGGTTPTDFDNLFMTTNATRIDLKRAKSLAKAGWRKVNISIGSPESSIHDRIKRVPGAWEKTIAGFQYLRTLLKPGAMRINTVITQLNYNSLVDLPGLAGDLGADQINLIAMDENTLDFQRLIVAQIIDYNQRVAPIFAEKAIARNLIRQVKEEYPFGSTPSEIVQSLEELYARDLQQSPLFCSFDSCFN
jgi:MoaA/NifB/PqqE/SkfB family radical SAM enzyme